jgi:hypothetical protein
MGVTIHKTGEAPSEQLVAAAKAYETVTDSTGRAISVRKLTPFDCMQMSKVVGGESATNQMYMVYAMVAYSVKEINGETVVPPRTERELETIVQRLGEEGFEAASEAVGGFYAKMADKKAALAEAKK